MPINFCFCSKKGSIALGASISNTVLGKGDTFVVGVGCVNESSLDIEHIQIELRQQVKWKAIRYESSKRDYLAKTKLQDLNVAQDCGLLYDNVNKEIFRRVNDSQLNQEAKLTIPHDAFYTYHGKLMTIEHRLIVRAKTDGFFTTDPVISIPVKIISRDSPKEEFFCNSIEEKNAMVTSGKIASLPALDPKEQAIVSSQGTSVDTWECALTAEPILLNQLDDEISTAHATLVQPKCNLSAQTLINDQKHPDDFLNKS